MAKLEVISTPKKTETTGTTDGKARGDKPSNKKTETIGTTDGKTGVGKPSNEKIETTATNDDKTGGDKHTIKKKQQELLMVKLEVISTP